MRKVISFCPPTVQGSLIIPFLGILAVMGACPSGLKVPGSKSCDSNGLENVEKIYSSLNT